MAQNSSPDVAVTALAFAWLGVCTGAVPALAHVGASPPPPDYALAAWSAAIAGATGAVVGAGGAALAARLQGMATWKRGLLGGVFLGPLWGLLAVVVATLVGIATDGRDTEWLQPLAAVVLAPSVVVSCIVQAAWFWPAWSLTPGKARLLVLVAAAPSGWLAFAIYVYLLRLFLFAALGNAGHTMPVPWSPFG